MEPLLQFFPVVPGLGDISFGDSFYRLSRGRPQHAIDIHGPVGSTVISTVRARVVRSFTIRESGERTTVPGVGVGTQSGFYVMTLDDLGFFHYYAHLVSESQNHLMSRSVNDYVQAGSRIGLLGHTGCSPRFPHLHYQISGPLPRDAYSSQWESLEFATARPVGPNPYEQLRKLAVARHGAVSVGGSEYKIRQLEQSNSPASAGDPPRDRIHPLLPR